MLSDDEKKVFTDVIEDDGDESVLSELRKNLEESEGENHRSYIDLDLLEEEIDMEEDGEEIVTLVTEETENSVIEPEEIEEYKEVKVVKRPGKERKSVSSYSQDIVEDMGEESSTEKPKKEKKEKKKKKCHPLRTILLILLILFSALFIFGFFMGGSVEYKPIEKITEDPNWNLPKTHEKGVFNILLIGTDGRETDADSRADSIIILSICPLKHKMYLTSILRDSYVDIPGIGKNRINHAYQMGGAKLLEETIEQNFHVRIDRYARVNFFTFISIIDSMGGVDISLTAAEADYVNGYLAEINTLLSLPVDDQVIPVMDGVQTLNGKQALSYARIRYIGTDFARTGRQRNVIQAVINKMKKNPVLAVKAVKTVLSSLQTDLKKVDIGLLAMRSPFLLTYKMESNQIPFDGTWWNDLTPSGQDVLGIDFERVTAILRDMIY